MNGMSLLDVLRGVMLDPAEQAVYEADPGAYLEQHGYAGVDEADLSEAFGLVADTLPVEQARAAFTGEVGPDIPSLGGDTTDFDVDPVAGGPTPPLDDSDGADDHDGLDGHDGHDSLDGHEAADPADDPDSAFGGGVHDDLDDSDDLDDLDGGALSFGRGEQGLDAAEVDGAAGTGGPADAGDGAYGGFDQEGGGEDDGAAGDGFDLAAEDEGFVGDAGHDELDDVDDLPEIDALGPADHGPDDLDIGSF